MFIASARDYYNNHVRKFQSEDRRRTIRETLEDLDAATELPVLFSCNDKAERNYIQNMVYLYKRKTGNEYVCRLLRAKNNETGKPEYYVAVWALKYNLDKCAKVSLASAKPDTLEEIKTIYKFEPDVLSDVGERN